jgi:hypothetical protein
MTSLVKAYYSYGRGQFGDGCYNRVDEGLDLHRGDTS